MLQGYAYYGTGNSGTDVTATIMDPILRSAVTALTLRGQSRRVTIMGISPSTDGPAWNIWHRVKVGNTEPDYRYVSVFPSIDADAPGSNLHTSTYQDLGGIIVNEQETISIIIDDPGTANHAGILWVEDGEPTVGIPTGRIVTLETTGANDAATAIATTGFDKTTNKVENGYLYTLFKCVTMPEDKVIQALFLQAGTHVATLPNIGTMVYPHAPIQFTGEQWNAGQVVGYAQVQAATKVKTIMYFVETALPTASPNAPPIAVNPSKMPGVVTLADVTSVRGGRTNVTSSSSRIKLFGR